MKSILLLIIVFEFIAFLTSLSLYFRKQVPAYLKFFPPFLLITVIIEIIGALFRLKYREAMFLMFNYFSVFEFIFYYFVSYHLIYNVRIKKVIFFTGVLYPIIAAINLLQETNKIHSTTYSLGAILLVCFCLCYFYEFFKSSVSKNVAR